jgi:hypothetical protein
MTPVPVTVAPEDELAEAARIMTELGVRHLPSSRASAWSACCRSAT